MKDNRKRIVILHHTNAPGGGTKSMYDIVEMLHTDYDVFVCVPKDSETIKKDLETFSNVTIKEISNRFPILPRYSGGASLFSSSFICALSTLNKKRIKEFVDEIETIKPDVLIFNTIITIVSANYFSQKITKICFVRETIVNRISGKYFKSILNKSFSGVCFLAEYEKNKMGLKEGLSIVIPDSVKCSDPKEIIHNESPNNVTNILFMGGDSIIKGLDIILKAIIRLDKSKYKLTIAGEFNESKYSVINIVRHFYSIRYVLFHARVRYYYEKAKRKSNLVFSGFVKDTAPLFNDTDIVVFPSTFVHQPRPCIEAGMFGKPVIISDYPETAEFFIDGYNALTMKPRSSKDLTKKIKKLAEDKQLSAELGKNNRLMSLQFHDYNKTKEQLFIFLKNKIKENINEV